MIEISPAAISEIRRMQAVRVQPTSKFQIGFASGGCQDFYYTIDLVDDNREQIDWERIYDIDGVSVSIVGRSAAMELDYLDHLKLDYSEDLMGGGFRFQNPLTSSVCGCGNSFSIADNAESARWQLPT